MTPKQAQQDAISALNQSIVDNRGVNKLDVAAGATMSATTRTATSRALRAAKPRSTCMPMAMKKRPIKSPRNGRMSASIWCLNSVSESIRPARNAPSVSDSPTSAVAQPVPSTASSVSATKISVPWSRATAR